MKRTEQPVAGRHLVSDESYSQIHNRQYYASSYEFEKINYLEWKTAWGFSSFPNALRARLSHP